MAAGRNVTIPYAPRRIFLPYHARTQRFAVGVAHRRCGKTVATINDMIMRALTSPKDHYRAAYIAPFRNQAKSVAWDYLKRYCYPVLSKPPNESELYVELINGAQIKVGGADNPDSHRGGYLDDLTLDEYADMSPSIWGEVFRPMLADRQGTATFIGTPKGRNEFFKMYQRAKENPAQWCSFFLPASLTGILPQSELDGARADMTEEQYDQEFECSFEAAILGAYFGREMAAAEREGRLSNNVKRIDGPIHCAWDFGNGANMAIWAFQVTPSGPLVQDFIQISGMYFDGYLQEMKKRGYDGFDYVPHDARVPSFDSGRTRIETMMAHGRTPILIPDHKVEDGINAAKLTLGRTAFAADVCAPGLEALRQYRQDWDDKARVFKNAPLHNWASHAADAFRYLAMAWREHIEPKQVRAQPLFKSLTEWTYDELAKVEGGTGKRERV